MSTASNPLSDIQLSEYAATGDIGLQDYGALSNDGLGAPTFDSPLGVDPITGGTFPFSTDPSLSTLAAPAGDGTNLYNDGLLPLSNPNPIDTGIISASQYSGDAMQTAENLPLTPLSSGAKTSLGGPVVAPVSVAKPMGASLWASLFGTGTSAVLGAAKGGTAGAQGSASKTGGLAGVKAAPKTAIANPISSASTALIIGVVASLIGIILWSFSGAK